MPGGSERLGVFGGTFDPPHVGHLVAAVGVRHALQLDRILMTVANIPWQKAPERAVSAAADRVAMVEAAVQTAPGVECSTIEVDRGGPSYTADTLEQLHDDDPSRELFVALGHDAAVGLPTWKRPERVRELATLVVVDRPGSLDLDGLPNWPFERVEIPDLDISSSALRERARTGLPLDLLVPQPVIEIIERRRLYGWRP